MLAPSSAEKLEEPISGTSCSRLTLLHREIDGCRFCERKFTINLLKPQGMERGPADAGVMCIGQSPGKSAISSGIAFAGNSFSRLHSWFATAGFTGTDSDLRNSLYLTSLLKCGSQEDTAATRAKMFRRCQEFLWSQINFVKPTFILLLGKDAVSHILPRVGNAEFAGVIGRSYTTSQVFAGDLLPPVQWDCHWIPLPHPSGLSRMMNDSEVQAKVFAALTGVNVFLAKSKQ
ncbi:MAG: uracil-DNA glycosylase family protein [Terrimicrobiaceae bacterium]|nr:uracil-DNA glycosylase family protein [Terrimicrobiaceae bacterium]